MTHCPSIAKREAARICRGAAELAWILEYELCSASRYRRFVSLIMISDAGGSLTCRMLESLMRRSDELFVLESGTAILMGETEKAGALQAVERYKHAYLGELDLRFAVASYPRDGDAPQTLLSTARRRLDIAQNSLTGAVISSG